MRDDLLFHYSQEFTYLRYLGAEFANKYPKVAGRLLLEAGKCEDPHVERLLEGFAFLAARIYTSSTTNFRKSSNRCCRCFIRIICGPSPRPRWSVPPRPGAGKAHDRPADSAADRCSIPRPCRDPVQVSNLLRHHALAHRSEVRRVAFGRPRTTARAGARRIRRNPPGTQLLRGRRVLQARSQDPALFSAGRWHRHQRPDRVALQ